MKNSFASIPRYYNFLNDAQVRKCYFSVGARLEPENTLFFLYIGCFLGEFDPVPQFLTWRKFYHVQVNMVSILEIWKGEKGEIDATGTPHPASIGISNIFEIFENYLKICGRIGYYPC
ncbi:MAG: hypothetical protein HQL75_16855 [Magnetococcales bacterium]|nr:hypothetical protein [Magnetococcales bacterium]